MKKLLTLALVSAFCLLASQTQFGQTSKRRAGAKSGAQNRGTEIKFHTLSKYKGDNPNLKALFKDREITTALRRLLKNDYPKLISNMDRIDITEPLVDSNGVLTVTGGVTGLYTIQEAMFIIEPRGNIYAAILDNGQRLLYYTNDKELTGKLPSRIEQWRNRFPDVPVVFKSK